MEVDRYSKPVRQRVDNLITSIHNYINIRGRRYSERDLCRIYYKVVKGEPTWLPTDKYWPYRRDELLRMAYDRVNPDDEEPPQKFTFKNKEEYREYCKDRGPLVLEWYDN